MQQILDGFKLMLAGMGTVFIFLAIMIVWTNLAAAVCKRFAHLLPEKQQSGRSPSAVAPTPTSDQHANLIAVISAAIHRYRRDRRNG